MVIGCITESQKLINDAIKSEQKGGTVNMCKALEKLEEKGRMEGRLEGRLEGRSQGESCGFIKLILKKVKKQKSFDQIVEELDLDADFAKHLYDFVLKHIDLSETDIISKNTLKCNTPSIY